MGDPEADFPVRARSAAFPPEIRGCRQKAIPSPRQTAAFRTHASLRRLRAKGETAQRPPIASSFPAATGMRQHFRKVHRFALAELSNLLPATESVRHYDGHRSRRPNRRKQRVLGDGLGNLEFFRLESKRPRHAATSRL